MYSLQAYICICLYRSKREVIQRPRKSTYACQTSFTNQLNFAFDYSTTKRAPWIITGLTFMEAYVKYVTEQWNVSSNCFLSFSRQLYLCFVLYIHIQFKFVLRGIVIVVIKLARNVQVPGCGAITINRHRVMFRFDRPGSHRHLWAFYNNNNSKRCTSI